MLSLLTSLALAGDTPPLTPPGGPEAPAVATAEPPPPQLTADDRLALERAVHTYRTGNTIGTVGGVGLAVSTVGVIAGTISLLNEGDSGGTALLVGSGIGMALSAIAVEVGAPVALVGASNERKTLLRAGLEPVGDETGTILGWACYGGQLVVGFTLPVAYVGAGIQHNDNRVPGVYP